MGADLLTACPACLATLRAGAPWCTLCYADLRPPAGPEPSATGPMTAPTTASVPPADAASWPCRSCGAANDLGRDSCAGCGRGFLADLAGELPALTLPVVGDVGRLDRPQRYALALGLALAVVLLTSLLSLLG